MHHPTDRIIHTMAFVIPVVEHWLEQEIAQWVHLMKDRSDNPSHHERMLLPRSYISQGQVNSSTSGKHLQTRLGQWVTGTQGQTRGECYKPSVQSPVQTRLGLRVTGTQGQTRGECYKPWVVYKHGLVSG